MRVEARICDRCKKEIVYKGWTSRLKMLRWCKFRLRRILNGCPTGYEYSDMDYELCSDCTTDLEQFLKERK